MNSRTARPAGMILTLLAAIWIAGCSASSGALGTVPPVASQGPASLDVPSAEPTPGDGSPPATSPGTPAATTTVRVYFFLGSFTGDAGLAPVLREVPKTSAVGSAAMTALLDGPSDVELGARPAMYSTIPEGTRLLGLTIDTGVATVNLSKEFESGGGSASVLGRLAQVVYTLTQFPTIRGVRFQLDGQPVTTFGGEGAVLDQPVGRVDFTDFLPAIWVDRPAWRGVLASPGRVTGLANVFEAQFRVAVLDATAHLLLDVPVTATCGTGCWGTFDVTLRYPIETAQWGTLRVYDPSAKDGTPEHVVDYPVWLTPG
jgi:sporulation and spore germination protein/immunoglobulin-like protein involved in spore germination